MKRMQAWAMAATIVGVGQSWALDIQSVTPQGQVSEIRQLVVRLDRRPGTGGGGVHPRQVTRRQRPLEQCPRVGLAVEQPIAPRHALQRQSQKIIQIDLWRSAGRRKALSV